MGVGVGVGVGGGVGAGGGGAGDCVFHGAAHAFVVVLWVGDVGAAPCV